MRHLPTHTYNGLTVVLSEPSRFDRDGLISGYAGDWFDRALGAGGLNRFGTDIRTFDTLHLPYLAGTKCILLLGEKALAKFKPDVSINEQRGCPFQVDGYTYVVTYLPQDCIDRKNYFDDEENESENAEDKADEKSTKGSTRRKNFRFWLRQDVKKSARLASTILLTPRVNYHIRPDLHRVVELLTTTKGGNLFFDIETDSNLQMTCFGFSFDANDIYVVPMLQTDRPVHQYYYETTHLLLRALAVALRDNTVVVHNSMFDLFVLAWRYHIPISGRIFDTMLGHNRCYIEIEKSLGHVISLYTDLPYHKNEGVFEPHNAAQTQQLYEYNGKDVYALTQIKPAIEAHAARLGATESVQQVNRMVLPYLTMMLQGMNVDTYKVEKTIINNDRMKVQVKRILGILTGGLDFNPNSWQQVSKYLYESKFTSPEGAKFKIKKPAKDPTNEKTLLALLLKHEVPAIYGILKFRQIGKQTSKVSFDPYYGVYTPNRVADGIAIPICNKRFTCSYNLAGTTTMRLSSRKLLRRFGDNAQNWEKNLRKVIVPDTGKVFVQADQSGAEALIVAYLCRAGQYRDIFLYGINPHCFLAMHLFPEQFAAELGFKLDYYKTLPAKELVKEGRWVEIARCIKASDEWPIRYYFVAKQGNHSLNYDARARMFRMNTLLKSEGTVALSMEQSESVISTRNNLFPELHSWHNDLVKEIRTTGIIRNLFGHPRVITTHIEESNYKDYYAFPPQSTVGQITNYAALEICEECERGNLEEIDVLQNNHDSLLVQCWPEQRAYVAAALQQHLNRDLISPRGETFQMKSEVGWSEESWGSIQPL